MKNHIYVIEGFDKFSGKDVYKNYAVILTENMYNSKNHEDSSCNYWYYFDPKEIKLYTRTDFYSEKLDQRDSAFMNWINSIKTENIQQIGCKKIFKHDGFYFMLTENNLLLSWRCLWEYGGGGVRNLWANVSKKGLTEEDCYKYFLITAPSSQKSLVERVMRYKSAI